MPTNTALAPLLSEDPRPSRPSIRKAGGKVVHDSRGNARWDWAMATGVLAGSKATELLRILDNPTLALEAECGLVDEWAGDPYNRG